MKQSFLISLALSFVILMGLGSAASFDASLSAETVSSCACTANTIKVDVENLYRSADTIDLSLELPSGWSGFVQPDVMLGSGESETVSVYITPTPCNIAYGTYSATLFAESATTGDEISNVITIETLKCHFVSIDTGETYRDVCQENGEGKIFGVVVTNEGKFSETFQLSTDTDWARFSDSSIALDGGEEKTVQLILEPPAGVTGVHTIGMAASSDDSCAEVFEEVDVNIKDCFDFEAALTSTAAIPGPDAISEPVTTGDADAADGHGDSEVELPSVIIAEPDETGEPDSDITGAVTAGGDGYPWESMIVAVIIVIVVLLIIYIVVRG